jgi:predicted ATPase
VFTRIQARSYRCLRFIDQELGPFRALVGPNASGKSTFLDVIGLLGDLMRNRGDVLSTVAPRSTNFEKLLWMGQGTSFELAVEAAIPEEVKKKMSAERDRYSLVRYEVGIGVNKQTNEIGLDHETVWLSFPREHPSGAQREFFPNTRDLPSTIFRKQGKGLKASITKKPGGNDNYYTEGRNSYNPSFRLGPTKSALANLPADAESFPVSAWFRDLLEKGVQPFALNSQIIRRPSPPGLGQRFQTDGSNLPWVIEELRRNQKRFSQWVDHVRTALEDIRDITTIERPEDKHRYLVIEYSSGVKVPSWLVSDGTLRLLALTIPAYMDGIEGTFLIEEPENGIHPRAIETVLQSLSSVYTCQVLVATHSPVALTMVRPNEVLCFAKDKIGATDIVSGDLHPALRDWKKGEPDLGVLFASGILS